MTPTKRKSPIAQGRLFATPSVRLGRVRRTKKTNQPIPVPLVPGNKRWLSATTIETRRRCPRCFWLQVNCRIYQPEGIVSRLANRFDGVIKKYFDLYRGTPDLPPL